MYVMRTQLLPEVNVTYALSRALSYGNRCWSKIEDSSTRLTQEESLHQNEDGSRSHDGESWSGSQEHFSDSEKDYENTVKQKILGASLQHVHEHGWSSQALKEGALSEGLPPVAHGMFPRGGAEIVEYFYAQSNADLEEYLKQEVEKFKAEEVEKPSTSLFIKHAVETRLKMILPYKDIWTQAMAIQTLPQNTVQSWKNLMDLSDKIWYHAGDKSIDFNWYTKRLSLAAIYKATEIFMLQDTSEDQQATWEFLDRRLEDIKKIGIAKTKLTQSGSILEDTCRGLFTMGRNILGANSRNR